MRDIGTMAQTKLEEWAAQISIKTNPAFMDKEGWDYLLQFPISQVGGNLPLRHFLRSQDKCQQNYFLYCPGG